MSALHFNYEFFTPKPEDGNISLSTRESRITEALKAIQPGEWIELEDGTKCSSYDEILEAVLRHDNKMGEDKWGKETSPSSCHLKEAPSGNHKKKITLLWILIALAIIAIAIIVIPYVSSKIEIKKIRATTQEIHNLGYDLKGDYSSNELATISSCIRTGKENKISIWIWGTLSNELQNKLWRSKDADMLLDLTEARAPGDSYDLMCKMNVRIYEEDHPNAQINDYSWIVGRWIRPYSFSGKSGETYIRFWGNGKKGRCRFLRYIGNDGNLKPYETEGSYWVEGNKIYYTDENKKFGALGYQFSIEIRGGKYLFEDGHYFMKK